MDSLDFKDPESVKQWKNFVTELYNKYYRDNYDDEGSNKTSRERSLGKKEKKADKVREKRMKKAQVTAKKAKQEEQIKARKSKIKTLIEMDTPITDAPKRRGRPTKSQNIPQTNRQKTLL